LNGKDIYVVGFEKV